MSRAKQKGTTYETQVRTYLNDNDFPNAERQVLQGTKDTGDIKGIQSTTGKIILQCKNHKTMQLSEWLTATNEQADNANALGILIHKRKGYGENKFGQQYATMTLDTLLKLLKEAGYE
jgi:hypothetical protein